MADEEGYDSDETGQTFDPLPDYHLRNPLIDIKTEIDAFNTKKRGISGRKKRWMTALKNNCAAFKAGSHIDLILSPETFGICFSDRDLQLALGDLDERIALEAAHGSWCNIDLLRKGARNLTSNGGGDLFKTFRGTQSVLLIMNALSSKRPPPQVYIPLMFNGMVRYKNANSEMVFVTGSYLGIMKEPYIMTLYDSDWVRCAVDTATERFLLNVSSSAGHSLNRFHYPPWELVKSVISWGDEVLKKYGNNGYKLLKVYEALCTGYLMAQGDDEVINNKLFFVNTVRDLMIDYPEWSTDIEALKLIFADVCHLHWISQLYGLHRIWGHPVINAEEGMAKVIKIGRKDIVLSDRAPKKIGIHFKRMFVAGFMSKYKRYPPVEMAPGWEEAVKKLTCNDPSLITVEYDNDYFWESMTFTQVFQLPETFNLSMIVADKSVSPTKSELKRNVQERKSVMNSELRRGVLRWLNDTSVDPRDLLNKVNDNDFPDDHKIIGLTPKERELNPIPRMFALMSHLMRVYVVVTESMISEHILPIFPQITMVDSLLDLSKKIYGNTRDQMANNQRRNKGAKKTICMSLDFEKWNGHMRKNSTLYVFTSLGKLFGLDNLFNATYDLFEESFIYLADGSYVPEIEKDSFVVDEPKSFVGHKGGMEGLRQKGWTLFTVVGLDYVCRRHKCQYKIMGMGDNQVLMLTYHSYYVDQSGFLSARGINDIRNKHTSLFKDLIETFGELGLPLKPLETWASASECLFLYGKYPVWKGVPLTMDLKRLMRVFPFSNMETMTVENMLNTVAGSATAAVQSAPCVIMAYLIGGLMLHLSSRDLMKYHPLMGYGLRDCAYTFKSGQRIENHVPPTWFVRTSKGRRVERRLPKSMVDPQVVAFLMTMIPRTLGGYVTFNLPALMMRGFPDLLSRDLMTIRNWAREERNISEMLLNWSEIIYMPDRNLGMLIEDITSVNHLNPVTPISNIRQSVSDYLSDGSKIKNKEFKDLMAVVVPKKKEILAEELCKGEKLHIRLIHDIYSATIMGYAESIVSKVTKTSTVQKLAVSKSLEDISVKMNKSESNYFIFFVWRSHNCGVPWDDDCATKYARRVRAEGWGKDLKGITIAFPMSYIGRTECFEGNSSLCRCPEGYIASYISDVATSDYQWNCEIGKALPYMGSLTKEKVTVQSGAKIYTSEPLVRRPVSLLRTINWFIPPNSTAAKTIKKCLQAVTDVDPEQFVGISEGTSGAEAHRYKDTSMSHGTLTISNYLYSTRYHISTDNLYRYSKGGENYDIHFQAILCSISESLNQQVFGGLHSSKVQRCTHWAQTCEDCIQRLDEEFDDIQSTAAREFIPSMKENKYLYVESARISYIEDVRPFAHLISEYGTEDDYNRMSSQYKYDLMVDMMSDYITSKIWGSDPADSATSDAAVDMYGADILGRTAYLKIHPRDLLELVSSKIYQMCECHTTQKDQFSLGATRSSKSRALEIVSSAGPGCYLGLALIYSWSESRKLCKLPDFAPLDEDPPSIAAACNSAKYSVYGMILNDRVGHHRRTTEIIEDMKDGGFSYKLIIMEKLRRIHGHCRGCMDMIRGSGVHEFKYLTIDKACNEGHDLFERYDIRCKVLRCSMDRLKKDAESKLQSIDSNISQSLACPVVEIKLPYSSIQELMCSSSEINRIEVRSSAEIEFTTGMTKKLLDYRFEISEYDILKVITKPTAAIYKYTEIFSANKMDLIRSKRAFLAGDGSGHTSRLYERLIGKPLLVSTLIDSDSVIPQSMPHLFNHTQSSGGTNDYTTMNDKVNNILHSEWEASWKDELMFCDTVISDIEILGHNRKQERLISFSKLLNAVPWRFGLIKDYMYDYEEFAYRVDILLASRGKFKLFHSAFRQKGHPEIWWAIWRTSVAGSRLSAARRNIYKEKSMIEHWDRITESFFDQPVRGDQLILSIDRQLCGKSMYMYMLSRALMHCTLEITGSLIPDSDNFTKVLGRLQRGNKPITAQFVRDVGGLKLHDKDRDKIREILLIISISMLSTLDEKLKLCNSVDNWCLKWKTSSGVSAWYPYLSKCLIKDPDAKRVDLDYIGVLSRYFTNLGLQFNSFGDQIDFKYKRKKRFEQLMFPVAKNMMIRKPKHMQLYQ
ncbi:TPA_asm: L [Rubus alphacytorhabdovirus 1]|nr:TPA_asm: L [Rubus alphacytorhabdovirus 1]